MRILFIALNRIFEQKAAADKEYREQLESGQTPALSSGRRMSDEQLVEKLRSLNVGLDRATLGEWCRKSVSAEELARRLSREPHVKAEGMDSDWLWICLAVLWERWFRDQPNFEMIDDKIQAGYDALDEGEAEACQLWLDVWHDILTLMSSHNIDSLGDFDDRFGGTQCLFNWVQDLSMHLWGAGLQEPRFLRERIAVCHEVIRRWPDARPSLLETLRSDMAQACFRVGEAERAESWFRQWLSDDPQWGWGWIHWSDCYSWLDQEQRDLEKAQGILERGLAVPDVRDRRDILDRLARLSEEAGKRQEAAGLRDEIATLPSDDSRVEITRTGSMARVKTTMTFGDEGLPLSELEHLAPLLGRPFGPGQADLPEVGRNDPCPCGSGKKYKKCCGRKRQSGK